MRNGRESALLPIHVTLRNQACVDETADLLVEALRWFRDRDELEVETLESLPLDPDKFSDRTMFAPLYESSKQALATELLLPRHGGGHLAAENAKLSRTLALRELLEAEQVTALFEPDTKMAWLSGEISGIR